MKRINILFIILFILGVGFINSYSQCGATLNWTNPSFESGTTPAHQLPSGWSNCNGTTSDTQPGNWGVNVPPSNGNTYIGLVSAQGWDETASQALSGCMVAGQTYTFTVDIATFDETSTPGVCAGHIELWAGGLTQGGSGCDFSQMVWSSGMLPPHSPVWQTQTITFTPSNNWCTLTFQAFDDGCGSGSFYVLIDNLSPVTSSVNISAVPGACQPGNVYNVSGTITTNNPPATGTLTITNSCGGPPIVLNPPFATNIPYSFTGLPANSSACTVTGVFSADPSCVMTSNYNAPAPCSSCSVSATSTNITCFGLNNGTATATNPTGTGPFSYSWNTTPVQNTQTASNLSPGTYTVTLTDATGCIATANVTITEPTQLNTNITPTHVNCFGANTGSATANPNGGTPPYSYSWNTTPVQNTQTANNLTAGNYTLTVTDANNCSATVNVTITEPTQLNANITPTHINCFGASTGSATANPNGGTPPYSYSWNTTPVQNTQTATNLSAGNYTVTITDANNCVINQNITINEPAQLTVNTAFQDVTCFGQCNGQAISAPQGGTQPYNYSWTLNGNPVGSNNPVVNNACAGNYTVTVTDANGCLITGNTTVSEPAQIIINNVASTPELCPGDCLGTITINATNALNFSINGGQSYQPSNQFNNLCAGNYNIVVQGINNCQTTSTATVSQPIAVIADFDFTPASTNIFNPNINFINTSQNAVSYLWDIGGLTTNTQTNTSYTFPDIPGAYQVCLTAYDLNGCNNTHCETVIIDDVFLIYVPNAFTPTGDGINDVFIPIINGIIPESYQFMIFNRWGELIFETNNPQKGWDGTHKGLNSQQDVYVWKIIVKDAVSGKKRDFKGHVTLLR
jgi:gliding motility-associated-like protein